MVLSLRSLMGLKKAIGTNDQQSTYWQAGKSLAAVDLVKPVFETVQDLVRQTKQGGSMPRQAGRRIRPVKSP